MRTRAIALALPLLAGLACMTRSSQGSQGTARTAPPPAAPAASSASADVRGHPDDQVVAGRIAQLSAESLTIASDDGSTKILQVVPETSFLVDGRDARATDLQQGQPVRASFSTVEDRDVAVEVHAGQHGGGTGTRSSGTIDSQRTPAHLGSGSASPAPGTAPSDAGSGSGRRD